MPRDGEDEKARLIDRTIAAARKLGGREKGAVDLGAFAKQYYAHVPPRDLVGDDAEGLARAAAGHWRFAESRRPGEIKVRAFNPTAAKDGWTTRHSVIEMVNDDMPFLVDSMGAALGQRALTIHLVIHPVIAVVRDAKGRLAGLAADPAAPGAAAESFIQCRITQQTDQALREIAAELRAVMHDVRLAVEDWRPMRQRLEAELAELASSPAGLSPEHTEEVREFLRWVHDDHFTFLGYRDYDIGAGPRSSDLTVTPKKGLGLLRDPSRQVFDAIYAAGDLPKEVRDFIRRADLVTVMKSNLRSTVHRPALMDAIGVKRFDAAGKVVGQRLFVGLFTSSAYSRTPRDIPLLRRKIDWVVKRAGFAPGGHAGKALLNILETYPRDELFQISAEDLHRIAMGILHLQDRQRLALFVRRDDYERFVSCLVYIPRDRYTTALRLAMQEILERAYAGKVTAHFAELGASALARLHLLVETTPGRIPAVDAAEVEAELAEAARSWRDRLQETLEKSRGEREGAELAGRYARAFPAAYEERFLTKDALYDIDNLEKMRREGGIALDLYRSPGMPRSQIRLKIYQSEREAALSDVLPMLEHMGMRVLDEIPFVLHPENAGFDKVMIHDFGLVTRDGSEVSLRENALKFKDCFTRVWKGEVESDGFNGLVFKAGLSWREIVVLRAYSRYLRQIALPFSLAYMEETLARNAGIARQLVELFLARFDPKAPKGLAARGDMLEKAILAALEQVASADEDRIIRAFLNLVTVSLRTNYFQKAGDGGPKPALSIKLESGKVSDLPLPKPWREITVYSPRVEGVHLRFGSVARGGLRWSDRREDFRTEVLGLVKAQQVKNAVIVPVGSKGGFVLKQPPAASDRDAVMAEGIACYKIFVASLLDITDTYAGTGTRVVAPKDTVRRDGDDPYLVVAADKGTATFSDIANGISNAYGYWLGDAFASGGSVGYDHKKMGITAKGAWECVKRHFREIGIDTQAQDFSVVGVGDMSGDVFGNGMLLSPHIQLLAAFNHMHIFLDPSPVDPKACLKERQRLFDLPRSGWNDYDVKLISKGGGVFPRSAKTIPISPEVKERFAIAQNALSPAELIRVLLKAPVDLLFFGGIGTYIKSSEESHADAGDRANDALRVNGSEVRAKVVGEGANLGVTQRGRIEYALSGGAINQDSIDNSAGVDCSDHEVNIKILIDAVVAGGGLSVKARNALLAKMTDEVGALCLRDNYLQGQAISISQSLGVGQLDNHQRLMKMLERGGDLDRAVEFLPDDEAVAERAQAAKGLTRPEIGVLLSYSKNWLSAELLKSDYPDDPALEDDLLGYFPSLLRKRYEKAINKHRLRRQIVATVGTNLIVNRAGETFVSGLMERTGMAPDQIARAFTIARSVFALDRLWADIEALDNKVPGQVQIEMMLAIDHLLDWVTLWFLRNGQPGLDIGRHVARYKEGVAALAAAVPEVLPAHYLADRDLRAAPLIERGVPAALAQRIAGLINLFSGADIVALAERRKMAVPAVARLYFATGTRFKLGRLRAAADKLDSSTHWQKLAIAALIEETYAHQLALTGQVIDAAKGVKGADKAPEKAIEAWIESRRVVVEQTDRLLADLWSSSISDLSMVAVASRQLRALAAPPA